MEFPDSLDILIDEIQALMSDEKLLLLLIENLDPDTIRDAIRDHFTNYE